MSRTTALLRAAGLKSALGVLALSLAHGMLPVSAMAETRVPESLAEAKLSFAPVVKRAVPAVVNIYATRMTARASPFADDPFFSQFFRRFRPLPRAQNSLGSGVILRPEGIVVSNYHVVGQATDIRVVLSDRREFDGEVILGDPEADLAVIRLAEAEDLPALEIADSDGAEVGDLVLAVGNPFGVGQTVSSGIVSALARGGAVRGGGGYFIQTDAPINPGNSGGALVDMEGRLLGINTSILTRSGGSNGIGFAIPANLVRQYVEQAAAGETRLRRPWAGIAVQTVDWSLAEALGLDVPKGVLVLEMHPQSPYVAAGVLAGDAVVAFDGAPVDSGSEMRFRMLSRGIGSRAEVSLLRDGEEMTLTVPMAPAPDDPPRDARRLETGNALDGLSVANVNPAVIQEFDLSIVSRGVVAIAVEGRSAHTQLRPGDIILAVNGERVENSATMERLASSLASDWLIEFERDGQSGSIRLFNR